MLPRATHTRSGRNPGGRGQEIQRLIGRALRAVVDMKALGPRQITVDCDVIQADGGTRTAAITGGFVALALAVRRLRAAGKITSQKDPIKQAVAAISAGIIDGEARVDLPYVEDSQADVDCNFVMTESGGFVEIQATAEKEAFSPAQYGELVALATGAMKTLLARQARERSSARARNVMRVVVATRNRGKLRELLPLFEELALGLELVTIDEVAPDAELREDAMTFEDNALAKARQGRRGLQSLPALADDSGLEVDALGGAPGVYSARYAGVGATDAANNAKLEEALRDVPPARRTARYRCVAAFVESGARARNRARRSDARGSACSRRRAAQAASATIRCFLDPRRPHDGGDLARGRRTGSPTARRAFRALAAALADRRSLTVPVR